MSLPRNQEVAMADLVQKDPLKQPLTEDGKRIWRLRMGQCSGCKGQLALGQDMTDGTSIEFDAPCPMCGAPRGS
jgi:hypothetical protein